ncbi:MAG: primosomal protein N' [Candidatus Latescibacteria bacterium]|nr:primosomal protein N' [bacterium]MBD3424759.1 primosomal protein N' [Candidatus Latescibacterota bacterium]
MCSNKQYADIALPVPLDRFFTYGLPAELIDDIGTGSRVRVRFGRRKLTGYVVGFVDKPEGDFKIRDIEKLVDRQPLLNDELLKLARWISSYYVHPLGEVLRVMLPASVKGKPRKRARGADEASFPLEIEAPELHSQQSEVFEVVRGHLERGEYANILLHGITGSGKTEVYLRAISEALKMGKRALVLIPEIALIPQLTVRFTRRFGSSRVAVLHSRLTGAQRHLIWQSAAAGELDVVIGPRSAVFVPMKELGIIVVDEQQDISFKQHEKPHYHAVDAADFRARHLGAVLLMGSATPSLISYSRARKADGRYFHLGSRPLDGELPKVQIVDMRGKKEALSEELLDALESRVSRGEQGIVLLNRRGHANFIQCRKCGWIDRCPNCSISLTYHSRGSSLVCHYCGFEKNAAVKCPQCGSHKMRRAGMGTQRIEIELANILRGVRIARMDLDTTSGAGGHADILERFGRHEADILLGTQMVAKGHHYPNVTIVGIVAADSGLNFPDYTASERTFQLLQQASGRAGRGARKGKVIVQTYAPEHPIFSYLVEHDFDRFAEQELALRSELKYPPVLDFILLTVSSRSAEKAREASGRMKDALEGGLSGKFHLLGPAPAQLYKLRGRFRYHIILKGKFAPALKKTIVETAGEAVSEISSADLEWNVEPVGFY